MKKSCPVITPDIVALSNDIRVPRGSLSMRISDRKDGKRTFLLQMLTQKLNLRWKDVYLQVFDHTRCASVRRYSKGFGTLFAL